MTYPLVFTSGGVGPTHDDVTYEGIAQGMGLTLSVNENLLNRLQKLLPECTIHRRLALAPNPCEVIPVGPPDSDGNV